MLMQIKSIPDAQLLWLTGFMRTKITKGNVRTVPDLNKICAFFLVTPQTVRRWLRSRFPEKPRHHLEMIYAGDALPMSWRQAGLKVCADGVILSDGRMVQLASIQFWPFIMHCVDWARVPDLIKTRL